MIVKLLTEHHLEFLSLKGGCRGSSKSTQVKMPHCWKSHAPVQFHFYSSVCFVTSERDRHHQKNGRGCMVTVRGMKSTIYDLVTVNSLGSTEGKASHMLHFMLIESKYIKRENLTTTKARSSLGFRAV